METGIFTAPTSQEFMVTVTAMISGLGNHDQPALASYAQLFILKNGKLQSVENILSVKEGKVADLKVDMTMDKGDTLSVFVGHQVNSLTYSGPSGREFSVSGFNLEQVRFCIFPSPPTLISASISSDITSASARIIFGGY